MTKSNKRYRWHALIIVTKDRSVIASMSRYAQTIKEHEREKLPMNSNWIIFIFYEQFMPPE